MDDAFLSEQARALLFTERQDLSVQEAEEFEELRAVAEGLTM